jgi:hypothetical protein
MHPRLVVGIMLVVLQCAGARAELITFQFVGAVDNDPFGVFGSSATFRGSLTFDSNMPQVLSTPNSGGYAQSGQGAEMRVLFLNALDPVVSGPYVADTLNITVNNDFPGPLDQYLVTGTSSVDTLLSIEISLSDLSGTAFSDTDLPLTPPSLADFSSARFMLFGGTLDSPIEVSGTIAILVSEPNSLLLLIAAFGLVVLVTVTRAPTVRGACDARIRLDATRNV